MNATARTLILTLAAVSLTTTMLGQASDRVCVADHYKIVALPLLPRHINGSSQVAGTTERHGAAIWSERAGSQDLGVPTGFTIAEAVDINSSGHAVGFATNSDASKRQAFSYAGGKLILLPSVSKPFAINDRDEIAGESSIPGKNEVSPVLWKDHSLTDLGACCGGTALALNNEGKVVGSMYDREGRYHAFTWDNTSKIQAVGPQTDFSSAIAINDAGHIIVDAFSTGIFLYEDGKATHLELSPKYNSKASAMNNCDVVVGAFGPYSDVQSAFVWDKKHGFRDLNDLVPAKSGWKLEHASSINDKGEIVGWGDHDGDEDAGFLLKPE